MKDFMQKDIETIVSDVSKEILKNYVGLQVEQEREKSPKKLVKKSSKKGAAAPEQQPELVEPIERPVLEEDDDDETTCAMSLFENPAEDLLRGVIMAEILGKPRSLRRRY